MRRGGRRLLSETVNVTGGQVAGVAVDGVRVFKGIPFAAPPVGDLTLEAAAACHPVVRRQEGRRVRAAVRAAPVSGRTPRMRSTARR